MATESAKQPPPASSPSWYRKLFEHWRNRNRIGPARVELPDCDFFIVGTRRTLRVLRPTLKSEWYYESTNNDRPESINDNFFTRWSRRPHSSNHCRCSFRQSSRLSTTEEEIISAELNRIRTSLCEAEKSEQGIEELEQRVSANLQKLQSAVPVAANSDEEAFEVASNIVLSTNSCDERADEQKIKNKIVKDLERYINVLLEEILDDTVKLVARADAVADDNDDGGGTLVKKNKANSKKKPHFNDSRCEGKSPANEAFLKDLSFSFHAEDSTAKLVDEIERKNESSSNEGYVNHAFIGSTNDPDSLDFYVAPPSAVGTEVPLDPLDCTDSGINSVETVEFQPDQEPSLEQSLLRIIDEKFGRTTSTSNLEDVTANGENNEIENNLCDAPIRDEVSEKAQETIESIVCDEFKVKDVGKKDSNNSCVEVREVPSTKVVDDSPADERELEEVDEELKFDKVKLELRNSGSESSLKTKKKTNLVTKLREKISTNVREPKDNNNLQESCKKALQTSEAKKNATPIEMQDYRRKWPHVEDSSKVSDCDQNPRDFVIFRRNMKPTIVFLHGFGSSAEIFEPQLQYFSARGYPCIAPDILGHGMSSAPDRSKDYLFGKLLRDLEAVLHYYAFKPGQKCVLVAHNYGCSFATALACKYDSNIHQLVLISGGGPIPLAPPAKEGACQCFLRGILSPFIMCGLHRDILYSARGRQHPYCGPEPVEQWPSHMKYVLDGMVWPEGDYVFHRRICTPTLLVHGLRDNKVSLVQECQMERTMMKAYLEAIPTAGHTPMTDCPEQLNHMIHCFIDLWKNKNW